MLSTVPAAGAVPTAVGLPEGCARRRATSALSTTTSARRATTSGVATTPLAGEAVGAVLVRACLRGPVLRGGT